VALRHYKYRIDRLTAPEIYAHRHLAARTEICVNVTDSWPSLCSFESKLLLRFLSCFNRRQCSNCRQNGPPWVFDMPTEIVSVGGTIVIWERLRGSFPFFVSTLPSFSFFGHPIEHSEYGSSTQKQNRVWCGYSSKPNPIVARIQCQFFGNTRRVSHARKAFSFGTENYNQKG